MTLHERVRSALGAGVMHDEALAGGRVGDVRKISLTDGRTIVAKIGPGAALEGRMLAYLASHSRLPVPGVVWAGELLLLMEFVPTAGRLTDGVEEDAADHLAALHDLRGPAFGFDFDTVIGGLPQPNPSTPSWPVFFRDHRLLPMARAALDSGRLTPRTMARIETLCGRLARWIAEPPAPSLIHGDMWSGNVLCRGGRIAAFVDPAIYYADPEIELAFATLFDTFGEAFFRRYGEHRPIAPGFFEERRDLYNLYPLLVHARLFGGSYVGQIDRILAKLGV
jgi:fructosamine-3-kinase